MKFFLILVAAAFLSTPKSDLDKGPELVCIKNSKARNICYYNFKLNGGEYQYMDIGCKYTREKVLEKVEEGKIALRKDWKVPC